MKSKDIALILVMVGIGAIVALVASNLVFSTPRSRQQTAEIVDPISATFKQPPATYFNVNSTNPAPEIQVNNNNNTNPFNAKSQ
ncbi:MAG TPA: hypothetical protein VLF91_01210 [Candidatus Saccharimonadales bacterium]|nr:hypothetical protein [Candidatus Saccharimonadales bacterium]